MRNQRRSGASTRSEQRRKKTDRLLSWAIGIVSLLILAIGCIILISVFNTTGSEPAAGSQSAYSGQKSSTASSRTTGEKSSKSSSVSSSSSSKKVANDESSSAASSSSISTTSADESHQASYDIGSADWNAQVAAIAKATDISADGMTIHWLGNGGSPNSSLARVSPKKDQGQIYVVHLVYANGKWQADSVKKPGD